MNDAVAMEVEQARDNLLKNGLGLALSKHSPTFLQILCKFSILGKLQHKVDVAVVLEIAQEGQNQYKTRRNECVSVSTVADFA